MSKYITQPYAATVGIDPLLGSTAITLTYEDKENPARSLSVGIAPELGSNMYRFRVGAHELIYCDWESIKHKGCTANFVLWPLPNRVKDCRYSYQGQEYSLEEFKDASRPFGNSALIHGLVYDREWSYEEPVVAEDAVSVTTFIEITSRSPYYEAYPFASRLSLTYTLSSNGVSITYTVHNNGERDLPFGFAQHPYFATLSGKEQTFVSVPASAVMEASNDLLPTGRLLDVTSIMYAMFDLRQPVAISNLKLDHVYTQLEPNTQAIIDYRQQGMQLHIGASNDFTHAVIYTLDNGPAFCLEHQTCSTDAINLHNQGAERKEMAHLLEVHPGASSSGSLTYGVHFK